MVAHLGSGASMCAMKQRKSVATTMGFTALDGLVMSRRCGSLDPGVVLYLMEEKGMTAAAISDLLYQSSGLLGVSGFSDDMKTLLATDKAHAAEAVDLFVYRICRELGSLAAALGGFDALVFTAGIGEHAPEIRRRVCDKAAWLGLEIDQAANAVRRPADYKRRQQNIGLDDPDGRRSDDRASHLAPRRRKQRQTAPRGRGGQYDAKSSHDKNPCRRTGADRHDGTH